MERGLDNQHKKLQARESGKKLLGETELTQTRNRAANFTRRADKKAVYLHNLEVQKPLQAVLARERAYIKETPNGDIAAHKKRYEDTLEKKLAEQWAQAQYNDKNKGGGYMPFEIVRNDITLMRVDAIVNTANPRPVIGAGCDSAIHQKAGPQLLEARKKAGNILMGNSVITAGYGLDAKYVIHTVGPVWCGGTHREEELLRSCYDSALELAVKHGCESIAFPLISTGTYGFPKDRALQIAINAFSSFLIRHEMQIYLVVFDKTAFSLSEMLFSSVASYIDEHYVSQKNLQTGVEALHRRRSQQQWRLLDSETFEPCYDSAPLQYSVRAACPAPCSLDTLLANTDAGFTETLLKLIDRSGKKDSEIYRRANITRQHFSKIRNNLNYQPNKTTAVAFAIALQLDLKQTEDLIGRAGYTLSNSSKFDVIIKYFIERKNYDMFQINTTLFEFDQLTLGV